MAERYKVIVEKANFRKERCEIRYKWETVAMRDGWSHKIDYKIDKKWPKRIGIAAGSQLSKRYLAGLFN